MKTIVSIAAALALVASTGAFALQVGYAQNNAGTVTQCTSNISGFCNGLDPQDNTDLMSYNTVTQFFTTTNDPVENFSLQFKNNRATSSYCFYVIPDSGSPVPEPLSYCQNSENDYLLEVYTAQYATLNGLITANATMTGNFDNGTQYFNAAISNMQYSVAPIV